MAKFEIVMPKLGESIIEATITKWLKVVGDPVEEDDALVEIATDKVDSEIPSPVEGKMTELLFNEGDTVEVGKVIAIIETESESAETAGEVVEDKAPAQAVASDTKPKAKEAVPVDFKASGKFYSPLVKNIAKKEGISVDELDGIPGTGKEGRVTKQDMLNYLQSRKAGAAVSPSSDSR